MYKQVSAAPAAEEALPPTGTLDWLRSATSVQHDRVEALVDLAARGLDATSYARLLLAFLPLYSSIERGLESFDEWVGLETPLDIVSRRRSHDLLADLRSLGVDVDERPGNEPATPRLKVFGQAFGALYVVEGSRLGGRVLAARIAQGAGPIEEGAFRFLRSDGADVGRSWRELRASLAGYAADPPTRAPIVEGASETFACFEQQLARWAA